MFDLEEEFVAQGAERGTAAGMASAAEEGRAVGLAQGAEIGAELGYYRGSCTVLKQRVTSTRGLSAVAAVEALLDDATKLHDLDLDAIRAAFRRAIVHCGLAPSALTFKPHTVDLAF